MDSCVRCGGSSGPEVIPGDVVKLWLDRVSNPNFPEWVEANVQIVHPQDSDTVFGYTVQYDVDHLEGAATQLRNCDVLSTTCEGCCAIINAYLKALADINIPEVYLSYSWTGTALTLTAHAYSRQIGQTGEQVTIASYVFKDPDAVTIAGTGTTRDTTPADTSTLDWPGGIYTVTVTDSRGLINEAQIFVPPRPRYRWKVVTVPAGQNSYTVTLATGEKIFSVLPARSDEGIIVFGLDPANEKKIQLSAAVVADLDLRLIIHTP